jgi:hypothetical protein
MKLMLTVLCILLIGFVGLIGFQTGSIGELSILVIAVNGLLLLAIFGWIDLERKFFVILAVVDIVIAAGLLMTILEGPMLDQTSITNKILCAGFFAKGILTYLVYDEV